MYDTKFVCTYHTPEVFLDTDNVTDDEKEFIRNTIYRQELLYILGMDEYNEAQINTAMNEIYNKAKENDELKKDNGAVSNALNIEGFPTLNWVDQNGKVLGQYKGDRDPNSILTQVCDVYHHCIQYHV